MSLLVICEPLGLFVYTLTADDKYFVRNSENFLHSKKCNNLKSKNLFVNILLHFRNLHQIFRILKKEMTLRAYVFEKIPVCEIRG